MSQSQLSDYLQLIEGLKSGQICESCFPEHVNGDLAPLHTALKELAEVLDRQREEMQTLSSVTQKINAGLTPAETLEHIYESFHHVIPYDRIGFAAIEDGGASARLTWVRTDSPSPPLNVGYSAELAGSSLKELIRTGQPRVLHDLEEYYRLHPESDSTRRLLGEGMHSSLTCLLSSADGPIGFLFFSSREVDAYRTAHADFFLQIAGEVSLSIQRGRLFQSLMETHESLGLAVHDLRAPLTVIKTFIAVVGRQPAALTELLPALESSTTSMSGLVDDILEYSQMGSRKLTLKRTVTDLETFLERSHGLNRALAESKGIEFKLELERPLPAVQIDARRFHQVLNNLLSNAFKFSEPQTTVTLAARLVDSGVEISVSDQGPGIREEEMDKLFKPFLRTSARPTGGETSTGLGLVICRWIVEAHGGKISVHSIPGEGSTFAVSLPA